MVEPRWELKIGSSVIATDSEYGRLHDLILDPIQGRVVALIVRQYGPAPSHTVVIPEEVVTNATDNEVLLTFSREQLDALPEYKPDTGLVVDGQQYDVDDKSYAVRGELGFEVGRAPTALRPGILESQLDRSRKDRQALQLQAGQNVFCRDGHVGKVSLMLINANGQVKGFVMHSGHLPGRQLMVPVAWVQSVDNETVHLSIEKIALVDVPVYNPDYVLADKVDHELWADNILRETDYKEIDLAVENGVVVLRGHVITPMNKTRAEEAAHRVQGVLGVENDLVVDNDLVIKVAQALGNEPRTQPERILVTARNGVITLSGQVARAAIRQAAEEVAASITAVRGISNYIQAPSVVIDPMEEEVLQPPISREVFATDMFLGQVERVIINPHIRRVTAFVVHGYFPEIRDAGDPGLPEWYTQPERRAVVPIRSVRHATESSVDLKIRSVDVARNHNYDPADFVSPPEDWQPPFPYHRTDVLFVKER